MGKPATVPALRTGQSRKPPPGDLALLQAFVNTHDPDDDAPAEDFTDPAAVERWLVHYELMRPPAEPLTRDEFERVLAFREALRAVLVAKNGGPPAGEAIDTLNAAARDAQLRIELDGDARAHLAPVGTGVGEAIARLLGIVERAQTAGTWERLKGCPDHDCGWIFYDWSKNRSSTWCSMEVCGNRNKARAFRERRRGSRAH